jgi:hypothetical protein
MKRFPHAVGSHPSALESIVMHPIRAIVFATFLVAAAANAAERTRYLELINRAHDSVTSLTIAKAGEDVFRAVPFGDPLGGGGDSTTIEVVGNTCRYDLRFTLRDGRALIYRDIDICHQHRLHIRRLPRSTR